MAKKTTRMKAPELPVPQSRAEAESLLGEIGRLQREVDQFEKKMNDRLAAIKEEYEAKAAPMNERTEMLFQALQAWAEGHKGELLEGKAKSARLATGELGWRKSPPSVRISGADAVIERLEAMGLERFVRTKKEVNKEAVRDDPEAAAGVKGITVSAREDFWAKPFASQIERSRKAA